MKKAILLLSIIPILLSAIASAQQGEVTQSVGRRARGMGAPYILCSSAVPSPLGGGGTITTNSTPLATCTVPGNLLGPNDGLRIYVLASCTNSSNTKSLRVKWNGGTALTLQPTTNPSVLGTLFIKNRGATGSQVMTPNTTQIFQIISVPVQTASVDTTQSVPLSFEAQTTLETGISVTGLTGNGSSCVATVASGAYNTGDFIYVSGGSGCGSGTQNVGSSSTSTVTASNISSTQFSYPCTCNGGSPTGATAQRFSNIQVEDYEVEVIPASY